MLRRGGRMTPSQRRTLVIIPIWLSSVAWMWYWWFSPEHMQQPMLFFILSIALLYEFTVLPSVFLFFVLRAKKPDRKLAQKNLRVAVISLCVPNKETTEIIERQLKAMVDITYPHDSWILDEGGSKHVERLAKQYGVRYFTRKGIKKYNQSLPPFQKKTKAGNVNAWLEHVKRRKYQYFVQLDIDHLPRPNYLNKTLGYFKDPNVAWVQAPSIYGNLENWTARGAAEQELVLQGPLQMGFFGYAHTPFIIGSHSTYRMSAIREIGGFQPTRAEDHLDTLYLAHHGYRGVYLPEIIAEGDGPDSLSTYLKQQFAWAYSMFQVFMYHTPKLLKKMSWRHRVLFLFAQTWYPFWSVSYMVLFFSPLAALWTHENIARVDPVKMLVHFVPIFLAGFLVWWAARPLMQPASLRLSWRGMILHAVRWPIIVRAIISALFKVKKPYMITPKGRTQNEAPKINVYRPFLILGTISAVSVLFAAILGLSTRLEYQIVFALSNTGFMFSICAVDMGIQFKKLKPSWKEVKLNWMKPLLATLSLFILLLVSASSPLILPYSKDVYAESSVPVATKVHREMTTQELIAQISIIKNDTKNPPKLGLYNPSSVLKEKSEPYIQHTFVDWRADNYLAYSVAQTLQSGNTPLITIEPQGELDGNRLLSEITAGLHDTKLKKIRDVIHASNQPVYIRFAHEMDLASLYPWGNQNPDLFKQAYVHTYDVLKADNSKVKMVWSPAGNDNAAKYYPGDEFVDVIGTTILHDEYWYGSQKLSFEDVSRGRLWMLAYQKPLWVVEFGAGRTNETNQRYLIKSALSLYQSLGFDALLYINMKDANIDGPDYRLNCICDFAGIHRVEKSAVLAPKQYQKKAVELQGDFKENKTEQLNIESLWLNPLESSRRNLP